MIKFPVFEWCAPQTQREEIPQGAKIFTAWPNTLCAIEGKSLPLEYGDAMGRQKLLMRIGESPKFLIYLPLECS